ncbi:Hypothetical protein R9X50_00522800 [Acrodontium crateriforme]|uniref:Epoxide hydrolase n=1 Tax=Acrodontium crateriforme TaxID=150365 RepID=A0AAQ3M6R1_9PEZI|nr:Hypothetical protein R9X50_00522800 [Acrodontium crateriforme]
MDPPRRKPRVLLFDIGGVCVVSPFQAILDYEKSIGIPPGWVNSSISASGHDGAWQKLERGEILCDEAFFSGFKRDLTDEKRWRAFCVRQPGLDQNNLPPVPNIDAEWLYWEMMRIARAPDPHMYPALKRLRAVANKSEGRLIIAALSNTSIFPVGHPFTDETTPEGQQNKELKSLFDLFISSAHVGMRKPDENIYRYAITRVHEYAKTTFPNDLGVRPGDIVFLDDIGANLRTAKNLGMGTIKVQLGRADKAVTELEKIMGLDLQDQKAKL